MMGKDGQQLRDLRGEMKKSREGKSREGQVLFGGRKGKMTGGKKFFFGRETGEPLEVFCWQLRCFGAS